MGETERTDDGSDGGGVFGNLPRTRPSVRSPRRTRRPEARASRSASAVESDRPQARPSVRLRKRAAAPAPREPEPREPPREEPPVPPRASSEREGELPDGSEIGSLEDLAWAGITVAAEAATLGVRLASRAMEAVRDTVERR